MSETLCVASRCNAQLRTRKRGYIMEKTNVMRVLDQKKVKYVPHSIGDNSTMTGADVADALGKPPEVVFKTLVTVGKSGANYVFVVPIGGELDLKKAAKAVGEKSIEMLKSRELLPLTGYIHGGCSPIGMKKFFKTTFDISAKDKDTICFSAGRIGYQVELSPSDLPKVIRFQYADIAAGRRSSSEAL